MKAALVYARMGWRVVPLHGQVAGGCTCSKGRSCPAPGKHPRIREWHSQATSDVNAIAAWQALWPDGNIGVATGKEFFALDVDGARGAASLATLIAAHGPLPDTVYQRTGSGGTHYLFRTPPGMIVRNNASKLAPGLDIRGEGGQIVVAPSVGVRGAYTWIRPPWQHDISTAPAWLVTLLNGPVPGPPTPRPGLFPAASAQVLDRGRAALADHGPAVEGEGGDEHTFRAAAILTHDFALTFDEAWPLLCEWNRDCAPPWAELELAAKLRNGEKYGSRPKGHLRAPEALAMGRAIIAAFDGGDIGALLKRLAHVLAIATATDWPQLEADFRSMTGHGFKRFGVREPVRFDDAPPDSITVTTELAAVADKATAVLAKHVFTRNGVLCEVVRAERTTFLSDLTPARAIDLLSRNTKWVRHDTKGAITSTTPPDVIAQILCARRVHQDIRVIESVTTAPVFLADGSILQERGYNPKSKVFLEPSVTVSVRDRPTQADAEDAVQRFLDLLSDFHFAERADFSAWLAGVLSPLAKAATQNAPVPLIAVSASNRGAGKTLLASIAARIITGQPAEVRPYNPRDPGEWGKRLTAFVRAASPISVFDNVTGVFGDESLDRLLTSSTWSDRVLGASDAPPIPVTTVWWATGNNIEPHGDTVRRVLPVRLVVDTEKPQERSGFRHADIEQHVTDHRAIYLTAALTILRAYHVDNRPDQRLPAWGSFGTWSALIRAALVWAGLPDPFLTQARAAQAWDEPDLEAHDFWCSVIRDSDGSPTSIALLANQRGAQGVLGIRESVTPYTLRRFVHRFVGRPRLGQRIAKAGGKYVLIGVSATA